MRNPVLPTLCLVLATTLAAAKESPKTISDYAETMSDIGARLDAQVSERQKAGDMAAAQKLVLTSAMVKRTADEFRAAEQEQLTDALSALPAPIPARAADALAVAGRAETEVGARGFVDTAQHAFNALLGALPIKVPHPVVYGLLSRDLSDAPLPADIVVYGYRLTDRVLGARPSVWFGKSEMPATLDGDERLNIALPDEVKQAVGFAPAPCATRAGFGLRVRDSYAQAKGFWPITWHEEVVTNADLYTLPTPVFYAVQATVSAQEAAPVSTTATFEQNSELAGADCEQTRAFSVSSTLPPGAKDASCTGEWVGLSGATHAVARCAVVSGVARATGELTGGQRICSPENLCTCPNAAQGFLTLKGAYRIEEPSRRIEVAADPAPLTFVAGGVAETKLPLAAGQRLRHVALDVSRRNCPRAADHIDLNLGDDPQGEAQAVSKTGAFRASLAAATVRVGASEAFAAEVGKTP